MNAALICNAAKTCLVLLIGFVVFGYEASAKNLLGIGIAVCGLMYYSHVKLKVIAAESTAIAGTAAGVSSPPASN